MILNSENERKGISFFSEVQNCILYHRVLGGLVSVMGAVAADEERGRSRLGSVHQQEHVSSHSEFQSAGPTAPSDFGIGNKVRSAL